MVDGPTALPADWKNYVEITASGEDEVAHAVLRGKFELEIDEPPFVDIGLDSAPSPALYLLTATAGCQVEVLRQCLAKARVEEYDIDMYAEFLSDDVEYIQDGAPAGYPKNTGIKYDQIRMEVGIETTPEYEARVKRCLDVCEDACNVSRSVEAGVDIQLDKRLDVTE